MKFPILLLACLIAFQCRADTNLSTYVGNFIGNGGGLTNVAGGSSTANTVQTNGSGQVTAALSFTSSGNAFTGNGSGLTGIPSTSITGLGNAALADTNNMNVRGATNVWGTLNQTNLPGAAVTNTETGVTLTGTFSGGGAGLTGLNMTNIPNFWNGITLAGATIQTNGGIGSATGVTLYLTNYSRFSNCASIYFQYTGGSLASITNLFSVTSASWPTFVYGTIDSYHTNDLVLLNLYKNKQVPVNNGLAYFISTALTVSTPYIFEIILPLQ